MMLVACGANSDGSKFREIERLSDSIPEFPSTTLISEDKASRGITAGIYRYYRSQAKYEDVKQYYMNELPKAGWAFSHETALKDWWQDLGGRELEFHRRGAPEYYVAIQYAGEKASYKWDYAITIGWGD